MFGLLAFSQQSTRLAQYFFNPMLLNPAAAGSEHQWALGGGFKSLFSNVPGSPKTQFVSADGAILDKKVGVGVILENDLAGLLGQRKILVNGDYRIRIKQNDYLSLGLGAGIKQHIFDGTKSTFNDPNDVSISSLYMSLIKPSLSAGVYYFTPKTKVGISLENAIIYEINYTEVERVITSLPSARVYLSAQHRIGLGSDFAFVPGFLLKLEKYKLTQLDITPMLEIKKRFLAGVGLRPKESVSLIFQTRVTDQFSAGYAYDFQLNGLASVSNGSHELMIKYLFSQKNPIFTNPRSYL